MSFSSYIGSRANTRLPNLLRILPILLCIGDILGLLACLRLSLELRLGQQLNWFDPIVYGFFLMLIAGLYLADAYRPDTQIAGLRVAASLIVPESVASPLDYYANNTRNTLNLLRCCHVMGVNQIIFSSTAAVYGETTEKPVTESAATLPINPYGRSKLMSEWLIKDYAVASSMRYVILRYFNVAGADPGGRLGQMSANATHLIRAACDAALKRKPELEIYGTDFPTPDGTGIRDYIHVEDLATAHVDALRYLEQGHKSQIFNCGYGQGYSVRQVIERVKAISGVDFPVIFAQRRLGDPACVTACADKIRKVLGWQPKYNDLDKIIYTTIAWEMRRDGLVMSPLSLMQRHSTDVDKSIHDRLRKAS